MRWVEVFLPQTEVPCASFYSYSGNHYFKLQEFVDFEHAKFFPGGKVERGEWKDVPVECNP
jgi:hypothetical protein